MTPAITLTSEVISPPPGPPEPEGLVILRREHALVESRVREQIAALDAMSWGLDRFYDGTFGYLGGFGGGLLADRADDRTHAPLPYLTEDEWRLHLSLVRQMAQRNHVLIGFRDHVKAFIGPVSVQFVLRGQSPGSTASGPVDADGDGQTDVDPLVRSVQEAWDEFCEVNDWGQGETDREEECIGRSILEGEATLEFFRGGRGEVPVCRHVEPELIRTPTQVPREFEWASAEDWRWGALTKPHDAETVPAIYVADPDRDTGRVVPANRFVRTKHNVDRIVKRGMSDFLPVAELVRKVSGLLENMGHVARLQAAIAWWEKYPNATEQMLRQHIETNRDYQSLRLGGPGQGANTRSVDVKNYDPGSIVRTEQGREVQVGPTSQPNGFVQVEQAIMRSISFRFGLPSSFSGEADSFASSLVSGSPFVRIIEGRQKKQQGFTRCVVERVILLCEESGRLPKGTWRRVKPVLTSKPVVIADEEKKARTFLALLDKGVADPYKWISSQGDDPKVLLANLASHKKKLAEMGGAPQPLAPSPAPKDPTPAPPGSAGGDGTSPNKPASIFGEALKREDRTITVRLSNGTTYQRRIAGNGPVDDATPNVTHELHADDKTAITSGIDKDVAALPADKKPPEGLVAKAKDLALTAAVKVYEWSIRLSPAAEKIGGLLGAIFDTPGDMAKLGYNPNMSSGTANVKNADGVSASLNDALGFGVSGHLVASIASKVIVKAGYWAANKIRGEAVETDDGFGVWATMISGLFAHLNEQMGVPGDVPDAATIEARLRELLKGEV